ncbi:MULTISPECIES: hypothetical protein [Maribacter]|uniref:Beta-lactamase-inhibitor-like PepSY-like domain-containing protein n=1 Tax=Maribacter flavus TaxID=1658664 RepID=A0ABU7IFB6_9FLAO|nr:MULTISPECIES: hypothetical protein [Maribacter]MDC6404500.1 hypothetical protein [Maribacter sp. PR66]MEE1971644.1 hypothetical protein [Maribacter flavus]
MKKIVFATALAIGSLTMGTAATPIIFHDGIMEEVIVQGFEEISVSEVPEAVTMALETDYPGATINKAHVNEESTYKLEVTTQDGSSMELYADSDGNWLEM